VALSLVVRGGAVHDGDGGPPRHTDVLVSDDRVVALGAEPAEHGADVIDATGLAVVPGFVNVLSHAWATMQVDGSAASEVLQGVTTEVFGEADSPGPADAAYGSYARDAYGGIGRADFARLSEGLDAIAGSGIAPNVASLVGGANLRHLGAGFDDRPLSARELQNVCAVLAEELQEGALGLGTALIYPPGRFASTGELVALCEVVAAHGGIYVSHLRSEGNQFLESLDELIDISSRSGVRADVYHLKAAGRRNWPKMEEAIDRITTARDAGLSIAANMYPYEAGSNPLSACIPPRFHDGGPAKLAARLADPVQRKEMAAELAQDSADFENLLLASGGGEGILLLRDLADGTPARGERLSVMAERLGTPDDVTGLLEIVARDPWIGAALFLMDPPNVELGFAQEWVSVGSDAAAHPATPPWSDVATHPRTYGTFARVLGRFARERKLFPFAEAVRRMTSLPADRFALDGRGRLRAGGFADIVVLDPATVEDRATWNEPHRYAVGVHHVIVNGVRVVTDGRLTEARPGRRLRRVGSEGR
jgi:N-acyl-D-amino-acid deacylase